MLPSTSRKKRIAILSHSCPPSPRHLWNSVQGQEPGDP
jgi:hypothetical protein